MLAERVMDTIAATQEVPREKLTLESSFEELGFDSLDGFNLLYAVEEELDVTIPDDVARELRSVGDVVAAVARLLAEAPERDGAAGEGAPRPERDAVGPAPAAGSAPSADPADPADPVDPAGSAAPAGSSGPSGTAGR